MRGCAECGQRVRFVVTHAMGGWGVERVCEGCGPLETVGARHANEGMAVEELLEVVSVETGRAVEDLRRLYVARNLSGVQRRRWEDGPV